MKYYPLIKGAEGAEGAGGRNFQKLNNLGEEYEIFWGWGVAVEMVRGGGGGGDATFLLL